MDTYKLNKEKNVPNNQLTIQKLKLFSSYSACIRRAAGYCCIEYQVCAGVPNAFTLDGGQSILGSTDILCTADYVAIPGKSIHDPAQKSTG